MRFLFFKVFFFCCFFSGYSQTYHHYYGTIHAHSAFSDGNKDAGRSGCGVPACSFELAKTAENFDFMGISEHNHGDAHMEDKNNWYQGLEMAKQATDSSFVALYGMEWGTISQGGHVIIYGFDYLIGWEDGLYDFFNPKTDYNGLFELLTHRPNSFAYLAHPDKSDYNGLFTNSYNETNDSVIVGLAYKTGPALGDNAQRVDYSAKASGTFNARYKDLLKNGYRVAPGMDHDSHYSNFGKATERRLVVLADTLTQESLLDGIRSRRFYASDDYNFRVDYSIGTAVMGEIFSSDAVPQLNINLQDEDGEHLTYVKVFYGERGSGENPKNYKLSISETTTTITEPLKKFEPQKEYYYYLEIKQKDKDKIVTAPIWFTYTGN